MSNDVKAMIDALEDTLEAMAYTELYDEAVESELDRIEKITTDSYFEGFKNGLESGYRGMAKTGLGIVKEIKKEM